jgi:hypothetical protein
MNWIAISGLKAIGQTELARTLAAKWVSHNYSIFKDSNQMYEKYNVASQCTKARGGGGEYEVQEGFGWTNGVILDLLQTFASELSFDAQSLESVKCECCRPQVTPSQNITVTPPQDSIINQLSLPIESQITAEQQNVLAMAALAAELAQNTPTAAISNEGPTLIRAA